MIELKKITNGYIIEASLNGAEDHLIISDEEYKELLALMTNEDY